MFEVVQFRNKIYFFAYYSHASHKFTENYCEGFKFLPSVDLLRKRCKVERTEDGRKKGRKKYSIEERVEDITKKGRNKKGRKKAGRKDVRSKEKRTEEERTK